MIDSPEAFNVLLLNPQPFRNAIAIIEPWEHVAYNRLGEHVRALEIAAQGWEHPDFTVGQNEGNNGVLGHLHQLRRL